jgi:acyl-lipid omega-6 desaturase (Delta-12 desaturase)
MSCDRLHRYRRSVGCHGLRSAGPELVVIIPVVDNGRGLGFGGPIRKQLEMVQDPPETRALAQLLTRCRQPNNARGIFELVITAAPFFVIWALMLVGVVRSHWIGLLLAVPAAGLLVRLFMIQHDCGHGSFFRGRFANDWVGRAIGVVTLTPYDYWRRNHARHHASSGNLDHRGSGDIDTLTVSEFAARPRWRQILYRLYRHPIVMFGVGPTYLFILRHRLPIGMMRNGWRPWLSTMGTNVAIAVLIAGMIRLVGLGPFLLVHLPITVLAASIGVWLFYVQHQFENTSWSRDEGLEPSRSCALWQFALSLAECLPLVHREHRRPPRPSSMQSNSLLSAAGRTPGSSGTRWCGTNHPVPEFAMCAEGLGGREGAAAHCVPRRGHRHGSTP